MANGNNDNYGATFVAVVILAIIVFPIGIIWAIYKIVQAVIKYNKKIKFNEHLDSLIGHNIQEAIFVFGAPTNIFQEENLKVYEWTTSTISNKPIYKTTKYIYSVATNEYGKILNWRYIVR